MSTLWGVPVDRLYQYVLQYYKKEKERMRLDYTQRVELLALFKHVKLGAYSPDKDTDTGYFDVVGSDRRKAWIALGSKSKEESQAEIVALLECVCPTLKEDVLKCLKEEAETPSEHRNGRTFDGRDQQQASGHEKEHKREEGIQFKQAGSVSSTSTPNSSSSSTSSSPAPPLNSHPSHRLQPQTPPPQRPQPSPQPQQALPQGNPSHTQPRHSALAPAALWCSPKSAHRFVTQMQTSTPPADPLDLAPGERVSVQVPTSQHASAIIWEFATEQGDIGFGLNFQRNVSVQVAVEQLLPVTPRDCAVDLLQGKHQYQDQGVYLLEFVNTHSTRPKIVYYRVFYQNNNVIQ